MPRGPSFYANGVTDRGPALILYFLRWVMGIQTGHSATGFHRVSVLMPKMCRNNVNGYLNPIPRARPRQPPPKGMWGPLIASDSVAD